MAVDGRARSVQAMQRHSLNRWQLRRAARAVAQGGVIAYATEAVFGLGCDPLDESACLRLLALKSRRAGKGMILIGADFEQLKRWLKPLEPALMARIASSWPGHVTWLLPADSRVPYWLKGRRQTLAVRVTAHPQASALCRMCGGPLVSTSANRTRGQPARAYFEVRCRLGSELDYVLPGKVGGAAGPSEIRDASSGRVIRPATKANG